MNAQANNSQQYDLNLFDTSLNAGKPSYSKKEYKETKVNTITATKTAVFMVLVAAVVAILLLQAQLTEISIQANTLQDQFSESVEEGKRLSVQLEQETSLKKVEDYARNVLGMDDVLSCQVEYINMQKPDKVEILKKSDEGSYTKKLSTAIVKSFNTVMAYLK